MIDKLATKLAQRTTQNERALIESHERARRLMLRESALFVLALVAVFFRPISDGPLWLWIPASLLVGCLVGWGALSGTRRAFAFRNGWLDGRAQMIGALSEAMKRGLTLDEWIRSELARDSAALGITIELPDDDERGET